MVIDYRTVEEDELMPARLWMSLFAPRRMKERMTTRVRRKRRDLTRDDRRRLGQCVTRTQLLTPDECAGVLHGLLSLQPFWNTVTFGSFYTLGKAAYLSQGDPAGYQAAAIDSNPTILLSFSWLYDRLLKFLGRHFQKPVGFYPRLAVPGFHIFRYEDDAAYGGGGPHFDLPYRAIEWSENENFEPDENISYVLPISLPKCGAGINVWPVGMGNDWNYQALISRATAEPELAVRYSYTHGELFMFSGNYLHQIAPMAPVHPGESRVTLQGHVGRINRRLVTYW